MYGFLYIGRIFIFHHRIYVFDDYGGVSVKRPLFIVVAMLLAVLCSPRAAMAGDLTVACDGTVLSQSSWNMDMTTVLGHACYGANDFYIGGFYGRSVAYDPKQPYDWTNEFLAIYGGNNRSEAAPFVAEPVLGYLLWRSTRDDGVDKAVDTLSTFAIGLKAEVDLDHFEATAICLFGVSNDRREEVNDVLVDNGEVDGFHYLEATGAYRLSESLSIYLVYRSFIVDDLSIEDLSGFGLGLRIKF